jgi:hypothetical protein
MKRLVRIVPVGGFNLFDAMQSEVARLTARGRGTFRRLGRKQRHRARWSHLRYQGRIALERTLGQAVAARVTASGASANPWQLLHAFIGWTDRHFAPKLQSLTVQYLD